MLPVYCGLKVTAPCLFKYRCVWSSSMTHFNGLLQFMAADWGKPGELRQESPVLLLRQQYKFSFRILEHTKCLLCGLSAHVSPHLVLFHQYQCCYWLWAVAMCGQEHFEVSWRKQGARPLSYIFFNPSKVGCSWVCVNLLLKSLALLKSLISASKSPKS